MKIDWPEGYDEWDEQKEAMQKICDKGLKKLETAVDEMVNDLAMEQVDDSEVHTEH